MTPALRTPLLACATLLAIGAGPAGAADAGAAGVRARPCAGNVRCRRPPGPPDRDVRPFEGTLGRPCGLRWRETPEGTRRVRVCA